MKPIFGLLLFLVVAYANVEFVPVNVQHLPLDDSNPQILRALRQKLNAENFAKHLNTAIERMEADGEELDEDFDVDSISGSYPYLLSILTREVSVGTPAKKFNLSVETGNKRMFLFSKAPSGSSPKIYDHTQSSTSKFVNNYYLGSTGDAVVMGDTYNDTISDVQTVIQAFGVIDFLSGFSGKFPVDGVYGHTWNPRNATNENSTDAPVLNQLRGKEKVYQLVLRPAGKQSGIYYGGDPQCGSKDYFPIQHDIGQVFLPIESFTIGSTFKDDRKDLKIRFDTGYGIILLPQVSWNEVKKQMSAVFDYRGFFTVKCDGNRPDWSYHIGGHTFTHAWKDIIYEDKGRSNSCILAMMKAGEPLVYTAGIPFFHTYCVTFDAENERIGLAPNPR